MYKEKYESTRESALQFEQATQQLYQSHYSLTEKLKMYVKTQYDVSSSCGGILQ